MAFTKQFKSLSAVLKHHSIYYSEQEFNIIKTATLDNETN
jgi:hypothetical protein